MIIKAELASKKSQSLASRIVNNIRPCVLFGGPKAAAESRQLAVRVIVTSVAICNPKKELPTDTELVNTLTYNSELQKCEKAPICDILIEQSCLNKALKNHRADLCSHLLSILLYVISI